MMPNPHEMGTHRIADRHREAEGDRLAKQTRKGRMSSTKRVFVAVGAIIAWMVRLVGGGGGV